MDIANNKDWHIIWNYLQYGHDFQLYTSHDVPVIDFGLRPLEQLREFGGNSLGSSRKPVE